MRVLRHWAVRLLLPIFTMALAIVVCGALKVDGEVSMLVIYGSVLIQLIVTERLRPGGSFASSGLTVTPSFPRMFLVGVCFALVAMGLILGVVYAFGGTLDVIGSGATILSFTVLVVGSAGEEFVFRGTMFEALRERFGRYTAIGVTSTLFGLAHVFNDGVSMIALVNVVLAGFLLGTLTAYSGSLWPAVIFHVSWNLTERTLLGTVSGTGVEGWLTTLNVQNVAEHHLWLLTGPFGIEQGASTTIVLSAACVAVIALVKPDGTVRAARFRRDHYEVHHTG